MHDAGKILTIGEQILCQAHPGGMGGQAAAPVVEVGLGNLAQQVCLAGLIEQRAVDQRDRLGGKARTGGPNIGACLVTRAVEAAEDRSFACSACGAGLGLAPRSLGLHRARREIGVGARSFLIRLAARDK